MKAKTLKKLKRIVSVEIIEKQLLLETGTEEYKELVQIHKKLSNLYEEAKEKEMATHIEVLAALDNLSSGIQMMEETLEREEYELLSTDIRELKNRMSILDTTTDRLIEEKGVMEK